METTVYGKSLSADDEGYYALAIAIIRRVGCEESFRLLDGETNRGNHKWTQEDYYEIKNLRDEGMTWREIGESYGRSESNMFHAFNRLAERMGK